MEVTITINTDSPSFNVIDEPLEVSRILEDLAQHVNEVGIPTKTLEVKDFAGNTVGSATFQPSPSTATVAEEILDKINDGASYAEALLEAEDRGEPCGGDFENELTWFKFLDESRVLFNGIKGTVSIC